jgi:hypothetical protein
VKEGKSVKHTPGPWMYRHRESASGIRIEVYSEQDGIIATCNWQVSYRKSVVAHMVANAQLIAAAPDLLKACREFVSKCECGEARSRRSYAEMKAAIEKAEGVGA